MATIKDLKRMCDSYEECSDCPLGDQCFSKVCEILNEELEK